MLGRFWQTEYRCFRHEILHAPLVIAMRKPTLKLTAQNVVLEMLHT